MLASLGLLQFGNVGWTEILVVLLILLLLFGARRLPEIGQSLGRSIREFKKAIGGGGGEEEARTKTQAPSPGERGSPPDQGQR
ncbi:MAG: twin-arginine translocase TatA/TatE family subunit [Gemmatimonadetes bacterium]|nr:twin-arginine translocase TatA/TatE family subunit [Gemmatimonadota bacterium]